MSKVFNALKFVWKNAKLWLIVSVSITVIFFVATMIASLDPFLNNTLQIALGGARRTLDGPWQQYVRYEAYDEANNNGFIGGGYGYQPEGDSAKFRNKEDSLKQANLLTEQVVEEGIVLLKNELVGSSRALPITTSAQSKTKISVFGKNSVNLVLGGSGSSAGGGGGGTALYDSLDAADFDVNPTLKNFYNSRESGSGRQANPGIESSVSGLPGFPTGETPWLSYTDSVIASFDEYKTAAIVVLSRIGGEGFDLPRTMKNSYAKLASAVAGANPDDHYLRIDNNERQLLTEVCEKFDRVIVLANVSTSMELGFLNDPTYWTEVLGKPDISSKIKGALWIGSPGGQGAKAIGKVLNGTVNPSGRLFDTFARDFTLDPTFANLSTNNESNGNRYRSLNGNLASAYFVEYQEGIYVGYRYYETRAYEELLEAESSGGLRGDADWWAKNVTYPFGYGLTYNVDAANNSKFDWTVSSFKVGDATKTAADWLDDAAANRPVVHKDDIIEIDVKVTNNGTVAGKEVVQLYYSSPYFDEIEKAHVELGDFAKTKKLAPGESDTVKLKVSAYDMASYDYSNAGNNDPQGFKGYKLDGGIYNLYVARNAHDAWDSSTPPVKTKEFRVESLIRFTHDPVTGEEVTNRFSDETGAQAVSNFIVNQGRRYMSRANFRGTFPKTVTRAERVMSDEFLGANFGTANEIPGELKWIKDDSSDAVAPWRKYTEGHESGFKQGESGELNLYDLIKYDEATKKYSVDYNDARWNTLLDQLTAAEMSTLIGTGAFRSMQLPQIGKPRATDFDGPSGFVNFMSLFAPEACFYASQCTMAATWNKALSHDMGVMLGIEGLFGEGEHSSYSGWYAPGLNIHRSPFSGRNSEYYSEDPILSGKMAANVIAGAKSKGVYAFVKHFAVNDQETNRDSNGLVTWLNEQTMREIYLKAFEIAVKEGEATAIMSSFNRIGTVWAGGSYELLTEILRNEWGFRGMVISDFNVRQAYMPPDQMIRAGGDLNLTQDYSPEVNDELVQIAVMRQATKNILYTVAGSSAMNGLGDGVVERYAMPMWQLLLILGNVLLVVIFATWGFFAIRRALKKQKAKK